MAKLQVLSGALAGQSYELKVDTTTVGRVEDNALQIADPSVSSHHCEVLLKDGDVVIRDLNSTNGSFINGEKITETILKPGQTLKLGNIELRIDDGSPVPEPSAKPATPAPAPTPSSTSSNRQQTIGVQRGVSLDQLAEPRSSGFDTTHGGFSKKSNTTNRYFLIGGVILGAIILGVLIYVAVTIK